MNNLIEKCKDWYHKVVRPTGVWTDQFIIAGILGFVFIAIGQILGSVIASPLFKPMAGLLQNDNAARFLLEYFSFIGIWIFTIGVLMYAVKKNRPMLQTLVQKKESNNWKSLLIGLGIGFGMNGFCAIMSILLGDIQVTYSSFNPLLFILFLVCVFILSAAEEIVSRGYLYQKLRRRYYKPVIAIFWTAAYFMIFHMFNPGTTILAFSQIFFVGILFALFVFYYDDLWLAMAAHCGWNFSQSIFFGLPNSGIVSEYSVFKLNQETVRNGFFYDINFGIEGSYGGVIVCVLAVVIVLALNRNRKEKVDYWAEFEKQPTETN